MDVAHGHVCIPRSRDELKVNSGVLDGRSVRPPVTDGHATWGVSTLGGISSNVGHARGFM